MAFLGIIKADFQLHLVVRSVAERIFDRLFFGLMNSVLLTIFVNNASLINCDGQ